MQIGIIHGMAGYGSCTMLGLSGRGMAVEVGHCSMYVALVMGDPNGLNQISKYPIITSVILSFESR